MKNHKAPYGAIRKQKESYGPLIWVNRTDERTDERTDPLLELAGFYPPAKNLLNFTSLTMNEISQQKLSTLLFTFSAVLFIPNQQIFHMYFYHIVFFLHTSVLA